MGTGKKWGPLIFIVITSHLPSNLAESVPSETKNKPFCHARWPTNLESVQDSRCESTLLPCRRSVRSICSKPEACLGGSLFFQRLMKRCLIALRRTQTTSNVQTQSQSKMQIIAPFAPGITIIVCPLISDWARSFQILMESCSTTSKSAELARARIATLGAHQWSSTGPEDCLLAKKLPLRLGRTKLYTRTASRGETPTHGQPRSSIVTHKRTQATSEELEGAHGQRCCKSSVSIVCLHLHFSALYLAWVDEHYSLVAENKHYILYCAGKQAFCFVLAYLNVKLWKFKTKRPLNDSWTSVNKRGINQNIKQDLGKHHASMQSIIIPLVASSARQIFFLVKANLITFKRIEIENLVI